MNGMVAVDGWWPQLYESRIKSYEGCTEVHGMHHSSAGFRMLLHGVAVGGLAAASRAYDQLRKLHGEN
jgi:MFS-type transporter involved in bile tolerance (Atg22 family)